MNRFEVGDVVRYQIAEPEDEGVQYVLIEWNGDRGFGRALLDNFNFPPVVLLRRDDIERAPSPLPSEARPRAGA